MLLKPNKNLFSISNHLLSNTCTINLNCHKTEIVHDITINNSFTLPIPTFNTIYIPYSNKLRKVDIIIDSKLKFYLHTFSISQSINYTLHNLRTIIHFINLNTAQLLATSLILPRLDYINLSSLQLKAFSIHAPLTWNKLPSSLRSIESTSLFKTKLKTFLFSLD